MASADSYRLFPGGKGRWEMISDRVMGGASIGTLAEEHAAGGPCLHLRGEVSLENNGGFLQIATDLRDDGAGLDARAYRAVRLRVCGDGGSYGLHLRTTQLSRPWQSYRASFAAPPTPTLCELSFGRFTPHRTELALDLSRLRRLGIIAIGEAGPVELRVFEVAFVP